MTLLVVFVTLVVCQVALRGWVALPRLPWAVRSAVFWAAPLAAGTWLVVVTADDAVLFPDTAPCPREPMRKGILGDGAVRGVSTVFPPRAYCRWEDGTTYELASGAEFLFWLFFGVVVLSLAAGLWHALRAPRELL
ncbi:hypothetical protein OG885_31920 [Streptomyces sp. NBC_00028]|uniref:hypothetical protein n=1 Tax=Streptomyces sp. NBC_00028 TaxID=2975624 RepID=UPI0032535347